MCGVGGWGRWGRWGDADGAIVEDVGGETYGLSPLDAEAGNLVGAESPSHPSPVNSEPWAGAGEPPGRSSPSSRFAFHLSWLVVEMGRGYRGGRGGEPRVRQVVPLEEEASSAQGGCFGLSRAARALRRERLTVGVVMARSGSLGAVDLARLACVCRRWRDVVDEVTEVMDAGPFKLPDEPSQFLSRLVHKPNLRVIHLNKVILGEGGAANLLHALPYLPHLRSLTLSRTGMDAGFFVALVSKLRTLRGLRVLSVEHNFVSADACAELVPLLLTSAALTELNLRGCLIGTLAMDKLAEGIRQSTSLERLNVSMCLLKGPGMESLASALAENCTLRELVVSYNASGDLGLMRLAQAMQRRKVSLTHLDMYFSHISDDAAELMASVCVERKTTLVHPSGRSMAFDDVAKARAFIMSCSSPIKRFKMVATTVSRMVRKRGGIRSVSPNTSKTLGVAPLTLHESDVYPVEAPPLS